jgi:three-Cys-motif partner protein
VDAVASDGLRARPGQIWTVEKLTYLEKYANAFTTAMRGKWERLVYIDLLAGPGRDIDLEAKKEFNGSPLIALNTKPPFDHCFFGDKDKRNVDTLKKRIADSDRTRVSVEVGDCNVLVDKVVKQLSQKTLGIAFIDPEGFEVDFRTLRVLATRRIDVLYWFPSEIGIRRNLKNFRPIKDSPMERFWGGRDWRELPIARWAAGEIGWDEKIEKSLVAEFLKDVGRAGFDFCDELAPPFTNRRNAQMYHLLFFSHDQLALKIWRSVKKIAPGGQRTFPGMT